MGDELLLHLIQLAESFAHRIEIAGELGELIASGKGKTIPELAFGDEMRSLRQVLQWLMDRANQHNRYEDARQQRHDSRRPGEAFRTLTGQSRASYLVADGKLYGIPRRPGLGLQSVERGGAFIGE